MVVQCVSLRKVPYLVYKRVVWPFPRYIIGQIISIHTSAAKDRSYYCCRDALPARLAGQVHS